MFPAHIIHRAVSFVACGAAIVFCASPAAAKGKSACLPAYDAFKSAQEREDSGHLREARTLLQTCATAAATSCRGLAQKCSAKYNQLGLEMPSVVPLVSDDAGAPQIDVEVKIDGDLLTSHLDGKGQPVDIGLHEFSFSNEAGVFATQRVLVLEGQRNRVLSVLQHTTPALAAQKPIVGAAETQTASVEDARSTRATSAEAASERQETNPSVSGDTRSLGETSAAESTPKGGPTTPATKHRSAMPAYLIGTAGLVGVGAGALLTLWGRNDNDLLAQCKPNCKQSSVDHVRALYIASDISFGVGAVALGAATWLFVRSRSADSASPPAAAYQFDVQPTPSGAVASVRGIF